MPRPNVEKIFVIAAVTALLAMNLMNVRRTANIFGCNMAKRRLTYMIGIRSAITVWSVAFQKPRLIDDRIAEAEHYLSQDTQPRN